MTLHNPNIPLFTQRIWSLMKNALRPMSSNSKVPDAPVWDFNSVVSTNTKLPDIDLEQVEQLERVSLVELNSEKGLHLLQKAVSSASIIQEVNTEGVEPMTTVFEERELWLREDKVTEGNCAKEILKNASITEEGYFVAPPGNIPLKKKSKDHLTKFLTPELPSGKS